MEAVVAHLAAQGVERPCLLTPDADWAYVTNARAAFEAATRRHGLAGTIVGVPTAQLEGAAHQAAALVLSSPQRPDAIVALAERFAAGVMRAAHELNVRVPADLLLVSGADSFHARESDPPVSALDMQPDKCATEALDMLLERVAGGEPQAPRVVSYPLHVRRTSTRAAA
jgi:DNA-binding LacI/PurR family transcriptional regulator